MVYQQFDLINLRSANIEAQSKSKKIVLNWFNATWWIPDSAEITPRTRGPIKYNAIRNIRNGARLGHNINTTVGNRQNRFTRTLLRQYSMDACVRCAKRLSNFRQKSRNPSFMVAPAISKQNHPDRHQTSRWLSCR